MVNEQKILMVAGEVSGDRQAASLARSILAQDRSIYLFGSGGEKMRDAGVDIRIKASHLGSVGFQESLQFIRPLRIVLSKLHKIIHHEKPNLAILVDNEGFNGLLAKYLYKQSVPFIYYFPPQVWLWGEWRAKSIAKKARAIIPAFPAEAEIYRREGGRVRWFGHPLLDIVKSDGDHKTIFSRLGIDSSMPLIAIMPGSRYQELQQLLPPLLGAVQLLKTRYSHLQCILPLAASHLLPRIEMMISRFKMDGQIKIISDNVYTCLSHCNLVLLSSGTATLEVALLGIPMVVGYRVSPLTFHIGRLLVKARFIAMPNILLDEKVVPELIQDQANAEQFASEALNLLESEERLQSTRRRLAEVKMKLGNGDVINRTAAFILHELKTKLSPLEQEVS